jgi:hypothetical protein
MIALSVSFHYHRAGRTGTHSMKSAIERTSAKCPRENCNAMQASLHGNASILGTSIKQMQFTGSLDALSSIISIFINIFIDAIYYVFNIIFLIFSGMKG